MKKKQVTRGCKIVMANDFPSLEKHTRTWHMAHIHAHTHTTKGWMDKASLRVCNLKKKKKIIKSRKIKHVGISFLTFWIKNSKTWPGQKGMNADALVRMRVRIHSYIPADAFASLSAFCKISRILCVRIRIPDRILIPAPLTVILVDLYFYWKSFWVSWRHCSEFWDCN